MGGGKEGMNLQGVSLQAEVPLWAQVCQPGHSRSTRAGVLFRHHANLGLQLGAVNTGWWLG